MKRVKCGSKASAAVSNVILHPWLEAVLSMILEKLPTAAPGTARFGDALDLG